jgi:hypothetical protein
VFSFGDVKRVSGASANIVSTELNVAGASLRYANTQDKAAARYHVTISDALYENTVAQGRETGILVIPNSVLAGKELNLDTPSAKKGVFSKSLSHVLRKKCLWLFVIIRIKYSHGETRLLTN